MCSNSKALLEHHTYLKNLIRIATNRCNLMEHSKTSSHAAKGAFLMVAPLNSFIQMEGTRKERGEKKIGNEREKMHCVLFLTRISPWWSLEELSWVEQEAKARGPAERDCSNLAGEQTKLGHNSGQRLCCPQSTEAWQCLGTAVPGELR